MQRGCIHCCSGFTLCGIQVLPVLLTQRAWAWLEVRNQGLALLLSATVKLFWIVAIQMSVLRNFLSWVNDFFMMSRNKFMKDGKLWLGPGPRPVC